MDGEDDFVPDDATGFDFSRMRAELAQGVHCFRGDERMDAFEARAAAARRIVHEEIMRARVWFMNVTEGGRP